MKLVLFQSMFISLHMIAYSVAEPGKAASREILNKGAGFKVDDETVGLEQREVPGIFTCDDSATDKFWRG